MYFTYFGGFIVSKYLRLSINTMRSRNYPLIVNNRSATNVVPPSTASQLKRHLPRVVTDVSIRTSNNTTYSIYIDHLVLNKYVYITLIISVGIRYYINKCLYPEGNTGLHMLIVTFSLVFSYTNIYNGFNSI